MGIFIKMVIRLPKNYSLKIKFKYCSLSHDSLGLRRASHSSSVLHWIDSVFRHVFIHYPFYRKSDAKYYGL